MNTTLSALGAAQGTDKETWHDFLRYYDGIFSRIRDDVKAVLEIGILSGASLRMWRDYFPNAKIIGADNNRDRLARDYDTRITTTYADQSVPDDLLHLACDFGPFDVIIDDGSHMCAHQQLTFGLLFRHLNPNGVFVIEDIHTSLVPRYCNGDDTTTMDMLYELMKHGQVNSKEIVDKDGLFIQENVAAVMLLTSRFQALNSITGAVQRKPTTVG